MFATLNGTIPEAVTSQLRAPNRFSPMLAGASQIRAKNRAATLTVRTPSEDITIDASASMLDLVFKWCDGTRTVEEVLDAIPKNENAQDFSDFLFFLIDEGALIDANLASAHAVRYGLQFSPFGLAAPSSITNQICRRFLQDHAPAENAPLPASSDAQTNVEKVPLDDFFGARVTSYTFDEQAMPLEALEKLLWSMAGVVKVKHPRVGYVTPQRTLASAGGMHLLEVYVALQQRVGIHSPGIYRVHYPGERQVRLTKVCNDIHLLPLAFGKPWELTFATGAIFLAADAAVAAMRYRSRALQYLFMEAGAALHNGALSASPLGLGFATIGGYYERPVARLCKLDGQLILGTAIFGVAATTEQRSLIGRSPDIDFAWVNGESALYSMGFHLARAKVMTEDDDRPHTWGRGTDPKLAALKAIAEAVEREGFRQPRNIVEGRLSEVPGAVSPEQFVRYRKQQYLQRDFFYRPFSEERSYPWALARCLHSGSEVRVLGELVFSRASLNEMGYATPYPYTQVTSSGCAASTTKDDATLRALLEVIERHAFMHHWLQQEPGVVINREGLSDALLQRVAQLESVGCMVVIQHLPVPWANVALVGVQHHGQHFTTMGTAAAFDFLEATESALDEVEARVYAWIHGHAPSIKHLSEVNTTEHHFELYGLKRYYQKADRVLFPASPETEDIPPSLPNNSLESMVEAFAQHGVFPLALDISPEQSWIDQGRTRLFVMKVLVPGLLPISFGHLTEPLGMVKKAHAASRFPHPFP